MSRKFVVDVDTGIDDAKALLLVLSQPDVEVLAITCVAGNTSLQNVCRNTLRVLKCAGKLGQVPVFAGCSLPLVNLKTDEEKRASHYHGTDGLGDVPDEELPADCEISPGHASNELVRLVTKYPGEITLVTLAPLTNIALAYRLDQGFSSKLKSIVTMGGNIRGVGNSTAAAEFNFFADPEAANMVVTEVVCPLTVVPWETTRMKGLSWDWYDTWVKKDNPQRQFINMFYFRARSTEHRYCQSFCPPDVVAMAVALRPEMASYENHPYSVEVSQCASRGAGIMDSRHEETRGTGKTTIICVDWNTDIFAELLEFI